MSIEKLVYRIVQYIRCGVLDYEIAQFELDGQPTVSRWFEGETDVIDDIHGCPRIVIRLVRAVEPGEEAQPSRTAEGARRLARSNPNHRVASLCRV